MSSRDNRRSSSKHQAVHPDSTAPPTTQRLSKLHKSRSFPKLRAVLAGANCTQPPPMVPPPPAVPLRGAPSQQQRPPPKVQYIPAPQYIEQPIMSPPPSLHDPPARQVPHPPAHSERRVHAPPNAYLTGPHSKQGPGYFLGPPPPPAPERSNVYMRPLDPPPRPRHK
ncbi:hypothetical protein VNI00_000354 [Paramarasmius palmivorus]|uniref:Uncharacterized protein n=1 Tax=Paramarasmius palmivorus TaxID=297713 RepID=A0AAW0EGY4_9AGAR